MNLSYVESRYHLMPLCDCTNIHVKDTQCWFKNSKVEESTILLRGFALVAIHPHREILVLCCQPGLVWLQLR